MSVLGKNWCFTLNNYTAQEEEVLAALNCRFVHYAQEICPSTGTPHLQGVVVWMCSKRLSGCRMVLPRAHWALCKGSLQQNIDYCSKGPVTTRGDPPRSKKECGLDAKEKWADVIRSAKAGTAEEEYPCEFVRYNTTLTRMYRPVLSDLDSYNGVWLWGPPGSGKSRQARADYPGAYDKLLNKWWDGYEHQETVLIDDIGLDNKLMGSFLKRYCDHYPFRAEYKGGSMVIRPKTIVVTSNYSINEIWAEDPELIKALRRRFKVVNML